MKLLLIEDNLPTARFIRRKLAEAGYECDIVLSGDKGLDALLSHSYALAIVDFMLPELSGIEIIRIARQKGLTIPMIILSELKDTAVKVAGINQGADDYVTKPFSANELLARINAQLRRAAERNGRAPLVFENLSLDPLRHKVFRNGRPIRLTAIEYRILELLMRNPNSAVSNQAIAELIWDSPTVSQNTVEVRISRLRKTLTANGERNLIVNQRGLGYVLK